MYIGGGAKLAEPPTSIEEFYKSIAAGRLVAGRCKKCGKLLVPPRPLCPSCYSTTFEEVQLKGKGKLASYTIIHIAPPQFQAMAPYIIGIVELEEGPKLPGIIRSPADAPLKVGQELTIDYETQTAQTWPKWPRYFFKQI
jgi:uncharacterized OB-fold protein